MTLPQTTISKTSSEDGELISQAVCWTAFALTLAGSHLVLVPKTGHGPGEFSWALTESIAFLSSGVVATIAHEMAKGASDFFAQPKLYWPEDRTKFAVRIKDIRAELDKLKLG